MEKLTSNKDSHKREQASKHSSAESDNSENSNSGFQAIQQMMDQSPQVQKGKQIQSAIDNSPAMVAQRKRKDDLFSGITQKKEKKDENLLQKKGDQNSSVVNNSAAKNNTGLPNNLKTSIESMSGYDLSNVNVKYNSDKPALLNAHAYAQGNDIHLGAGQEKHLPHEAWHVVQQKRGKVKPTVQMKGVQVNDSAELEKEADEMGAKATSGILQRKEDAVIEPKKEEGNGSVVQRWDMDNAPIGDPKKDLGLQKSLTLSDKDWVEIALKSRDPSDVCKIKDVTAAPTLKRVELIKIMVYQDWVGPIDESKIEDLWKSFGAEEYKVRDWNQKLFDDSIEAGAELYTLARHDPEREDWLMFFDHYLPKKFLNNYMDGIAAPIKLSEQEMIDCNPVVDVTRSDAFISAVAGMKAAGETTKTVEFDQPSGAMTNGTLGNFYIKHKGTITVGADGAWTFAGTMTFSDFWDFDPKPFGGERSTQGEIKTRIGAYFLKGKPFNIFSVAIPVSQSNLQAEGVYGNGAKAVSVPDNASKPLGTDLKDF